MYQDSKSKPSGWNSVEVLEFFPDTTQLVARYAEPVCRTDAIKPIQEITTPSGKLILDFGQNVVGCLRLKHIKAAIGHKITLKHAEVLEDGELGTRLLRDCGATNEYNLEGSKTAET